jgi:hypothetical protein
VKPYWRMPLSEGDCRVRLSDGGAPKPNVVSERVDAASRESSPSSHPSPCPRCCAPRLPSPRHPPPLPPKAPEAARADGVDSRRGTDGRRPSSSLRGHTWSLLPQTLSWSSHVSVCAPSTRRSYMLACRGAAVEERRAEQEVPRRDPSFIPEVFR